MKSRETKQQDLAALTASLQNSKSAMLVSFSGVTVQKDQEFRNSIREAGAKYEVVKNTLARIAVKGTQFENVTDHFKGVTAIAWTENDPVVLTKAISKFMKDNADLYTFKTGVVDGSLVDLAQLTTIANLPSKEELISKLLFVLNAQAQRIVTVITAVPRNLAIVIKQIGDQEGRATGTPQPEAPEAASPAEETAAAEVPTETSEAPPETPATEAQEEVTGDATADAAAEVAEPREHAQSPDDKAEETITEPSAEASEGSTEAQEEAVAAAPDDAAESLQETVPEADAEEKAE
jgi:large subunit ribosomal protein L10